MEFALRHIEFVPLQQSVNDALRYEVRAARQRIAAGDSMYSVLLRDRDLLHEQRLLTREQLSIRDGDVKMLHRKVRRMRWWRPLALGATAAAVILAIR